MYEVVTWIKVVDAAGGINLSCGREIQVAGEGDGQQHGSEEKK